MAGSRQSDDTLETGADDDGGRRTSGRRTKAQSAALGRTAMFRSEKDAANGAEGALSYSTGEKPA